MAKTTANARKKTSTKTKTSTTKSSTSSKIKKAAGIGMDIYSQFTGGDTKKKGKGGSGVKKSAKHLLKKAYERKAKRLVRMGMLGQARRVLRKKATVV